MEEATSPRRMDVQSPQESEECKLQTTDELAC